MRSKQLLGVISHYFEHVSPPSLAITKRLASNTGIEGGWEVWLQVEIALAFVTFEEGRICIREDTYPSGDAEKPFIAYNRGSNTAEFVAKKNSSARCDFHLHRRDNFRPQDDTYVELKCINPNTNHPEKDAMNRFFDDLNKIYAIGSKNQTLNVIALLAIYTNTLEVPNLNRIFSAKIWDSKTNLVSTLSEVARDPENRLLILSGSPSIY